jgi:hypothetical protein
MARAMGTPRTTKTTIGINCSIKFPFCGRNGLVERSLRFGARSWQAGMTELAGTGRNWRRSADWNSFSRHNHSGRGAGELIDKKCGHFTKLNVPNPQVGTCIGPAEPARNALLTSSARLINFMFLCSVLK